MQCDAGGVGEVGGGGDTANLRGCSFPLDFVAVIMLSTGSQALQHFFLSAKAWQFRGVAPRPGKVKKKVGMT